MKKILTIVSGLVFVFAFVLTLSISAHAQSPSTTSDSSPSITIKSFPAWVVRGEQAQITWSTQGTIPGSYVRVQIQDPSGQVTVNSGNINHSNYFRWNWNTNKNLEPGTYKAIVYSHTKNSIRSVARNIEVRTAPPATPSSEDVTPFPADLGLGSTGSFVTKLQNILISLKYLVMPAGVNVGTFGELTKTALINWQIAHGISPANGYFGPESRAEINQKLTAVPPEAMIPALKAECSVSSTNVRTEVDVVRQVSHTGGGTTAPTYSWSGNDPLSNSSQTTNTKKYTTIGTKTAQVQVRVGPQTVTAECPNVTVTAVPVTPTITLGNVPSSIVKGSQASINWTTQGTIDSTLRVQILDTANNVVDTSVNLNKNTTSWNWNISSSLPTGNYKVRVVTYPLAIGGVVSDVKNISVTAAAVVTPTITLGNVPSSIVKGSQASINWTTQGTLPGTHIHVQILGSANNIVAESTNLGKTATKWNWNTSSSLPTGTYKVKVFTYPLSIGGVVSDVKNISVTPAAATEAPTQTPTPTTGQCYKINNASWNACCKSGNSYYWRNSGGQWSKWGANFSCTYNQTSYPSVIDNTITLPTTVSSADQIPSVSFASNIRPGHQGESVALLQRSLQGLGVYTGPITGFFGNLTKGAVTRLQSANALEAVGEVGPKTRALLNALLSQ